MRVVQGETTVERRDFLSAIPGLTIGAAGADLSRFLDDTPQTDWTVKDGGNSLSPARLRALIKLVEDQEQWRRAHMGIDANAAGPDYPHPSQKVRVLQFFDGNGRLDNTGIQILGRQTDYGLFWLNQFSDNPSAAFPSAKLFGYTSDYGAATPTANGEWIVTGSQLEYARIALASIDAATSVNIMAYHNGLDNIAGISLVNQDSPNVQKHLFLRPEDPNGPMTSLWLGGGTTDPTNAENGYMWYRQDTPAFRVRKSGANFTLATTADVPTTMNKVPYAAKTADYTTTAADGVITMDASGGARTVTLVSAVGNAGLQQTIKKIDSSANIVTIDANGSQTLDGVLTMGIGTQWSWFQVTSDNANWLITGRG